MSEPILSLSTKEPATKVRIGATLVALRTSNELGLAALQQINHVGSGLAPLLTKRGELTTEELERFEALLRQGCEIALSPRHHALIAKLGTIDRILLFEKFYSVLEPKLARVYGRAPKAGR